MSLAIYICTGERGEWEGGRNPITRSLLVTVLNIASTG